MTYHLLHGYNSSKAGVLNGPYPQSMSMSMSMSAIMLNRNLGKTTGLVVEGNWINGGAIAVIGGGLDRYTAADSLGTFWRNDFDRTQHFAPHTIDLGVSVTSVNTGDSTPNPNVHADGTPIRVRHNA